ncbi:MAG TPA: excinuclease ABC subunit B [Opitutae bacterium]|nr:excinuclease ABC subunit B [Opitutaceae bacterium]HCR29190.1 excinuclease ABC subunit B [Opitutae bacterium]
MEEGALFDLRSDYQPMGDQPEAIDAIVSSIESGNRYQTLLGVTGSGKTFSMANIIARCRRPALVISHNKTLAAQLYSELKNFFPNNAVEYFVSYYDYYQPEAYVPSTDTFIEKDSSINDEIDRLRISATSSLISRRDVIVVASVSCIYGLGSPEDFEELMIELRQGEELGRDVFLNRLVEIQYERNDVDLTRGRFRVRGDIVDVMPAYLEKGLRIEFWGDEVERLAEFDPLTGDSIQNFEQFNLYPANQFVTTKGKTAKAVGSIKAELKSRIARFEEQGKLLEAQRISMRTNYDLEMLQEVGFCSGIENYSMHLSGRKPGERPSCLIDFFDEDFLLLVDESHVTIPQVGAMYAGDRSRKSTLVEHGFRLPSALDNRPMNFDEFLKVTGTTVFVSATPAKFELERSDLVAEQIIRPTGLLDPEIEIRPIKGQVEDLIGEVNRAIAQGERVLVTTLTKRLSEDITVYLREREISVEYLHSDIDAIERVEILRRLRAGDFDVLVGINLLREGLDLPEVALVAILDADKEGFLRSQTSLVQTAGRAARHENGRVIFYADVITDSIRNTMEITDQRRSKQIEYNEEYGITPKSVVRPVQESLHEGKETDEDAPYLVSEDEDVEAVINELTVEMDEAASRLEFERAALLRDQIDALRSGEFSNRKKKPGRGYARRRR